MKFAFSAAAAGLMLAGAALGADAGKAVIDIENAWAKSYSKKDVGVIGSYLSDDWTGQSDSLSRYTKAAFLADIKSGKLAYTAITLHDMKARVFGDTAVVLGFDDEKSSWDKHDTSGTYSWIDVFVKKDGKWLAVASQVTKVKK